MKGEYVLTLTVYADEADVKTLCDTAGRTERVYIVTAGEYGHVEIEAGATYKEKGEA